MMEPRELFKITSRFYEALNPTDSDTEAAAAPPLPCTHFDVGDLAGRHKD